MVNDPAAALRDLLAGQLRQHGRRLRGFADPDWRRYADLLAGAFLLAARRRFVAGPDRAPVIRFVAGVRERYDPTSATLDPAFAEELVLAALDDRPEPEPEPGSVPEGAVPVTTGALVAAQTLLLLGLLEDEGLPTTGYADFLAAAERLVQAT